MYAELYCQTGNMVVAISPLLSCVTFCRRHYFSYLAAMATMYLAYVQVSGRQDTVYSVI
jgi:hypothetical protein